MPKRDSAETGPGNLGRTPKVPSRLGEDAALAPVGATNCPVAQLPTQGVREKSQRSIPMTDRPNDLAFDPAGRYPAGLPASGAWMPGDPSGRRRFVTVTDRPFVCEGNGVLEEVTLAYETWGTLDASAGNAVLVCHALTGDSHAAGEIGPGHVSEGWWDGLIGPSRALDSDRYFVVCANALGGCQGSTGPASADPETGYPYGPTFPQVTIRDIVRTQKLLADRLGIERWLAVVGGSMGGMQVLEWGAMYPHRVRALAPLATVAAASAMQIGWSAVERLAVVGDPAFCDGWYYDKAPGEGPWRGLALARQISQITYRSTEAFDGRFGRDLHDPHRLVEQWARFEIESYLDHHGQKLVRRFDANSFLVLSKAMDLHDVGRGRGGAAGALGRLTHPVLTASITSDILYPTYQQEEIRDLVNAGGGSCEHHVVDSPEGHDGFLLETAFFDPLLRELLKRAEEQ